MYRLSVSHQRGPMREPFAISGAVMLHTPTVQVTLEREDGLIGRGEACGVDYLGETPGSMMHAIERVRPAVEAGIDRAALLTLLPPGGPRMALDAALWDVACKAGGRDPFAANGVQLRPVVSAYTIGIRDIAGYEATARARSAYALLKVKVDAEDPVAAIAAVRRGAPDSRLIIDPNQAWSVAALRRFAPHLAELHVSLIEQPIPVGAEGGLDGWTSPIPLCADELVQYDSDLPKAAGRFQVINIKLDKCGGLTAAMLLADRAEALGFRLMVGCMAGSSLSMAPAMVLAQRCEFVDLDGPLLQSRDMPHGFEYELGRVSRPHLADLWG